jgi:hypothetical protein
MEEPIPRPNIMDTDIARVHLRIAQLLVKVSQSKLISNPRFRIQQLLRLRVPQYSPGDRPLADGTILQGQTAENITDTSPIPVAAVTLASPEADPAIDPWYSKTTHCHQNGYLKFYPP